MTSSPPPDPASYAACVVGCGPAGMAAALMLARAGVPTVLAGEASPADARTTALMTSAVAALEQLGIWHMIAPQAGALRTMRIVDATRRLLRAPDVAFHAHEMHIDAFGYNIPNTILIEALASAVAECPNLHLVPFNVTSIELSAERATLTLAGEGTLQVSLIVGADGARSLTRAAAGITAIQKPLGQTAFVVNIDHSRPHGDTSTEFHTESGPFTLVPLSGLRSSVVAVGYPEDAERFMIMDDCALGKELTRRSGGIVGTVIPFGPRGIRDLMTLDVDSMGQKRVALIGEAAHVLPPIGAQGLNLGLRDASSIAALAKEAYSAGKDIGSDEITSAYHRARRADVCQRNLAINTVNQSLLSSLLPVQMARTLGLTALKHIRPLRTLAMRAGLGA